MFPKVSIMFKQVIGNWKITVPYNEKVEIGSLEFEILAMQATHPEFGEVGGSSAVIGGAPQTAEYELLERMCVVANLKGNAIKQYPIRDAISGKVVRKIEFNQVFNGTVSEDFLPAKSNGVAIHSTWPMACESACFELVERHMLLSSWIGRIAPKEIELAETSYFHKLVDLYLPRAYSFGSQKVSTYEKAVYTAGIYLKPQDDKNPLIYAFGSAFTLEEALQKAEREGLQRLGFIWGEEIPSEIPEFSPNPYYHQEYYLFPKNHNIIESWFKGVFFVPQSKQLREILPMEFADITNSDVSPYLVAKAISNDALPLFFGKYLEGFFAALKNTDREIHPVP